MNISDCTKENCIFVNKLPFDCSIIELEKIFKSSKDLTAKVLILDKMTSGIEPNKKKAIIMFDYNVANFFLNGPNQYIRNLIERNNKNGTVSNDYIRFMDSKIFPFRKNFNVKVSKNKRENISSQSKKNNHRHDRNFRKNNSKNKRKNIPSLSKKDYHRHDRNFRKNNSNNNKKTTLEGLKNQEKFIISLLNSNE